jgi:hypothetical protein
MIRKLILASATLFALSAVAQAANNVTTVQSGPLNNSTTNQTSVVGNNNAALFQFGGQNANNGTAIQSNVFGNNNSSMFQDSEATFLGFPAPNNNSLVIQGNILGTNNSNVTQVP